MKKIFYSFAVFSIALAALTSCETIISPELKPAETLVVVDAWVNNKPGDQVIKLMYTQSYFDNTLPPGIKGATVRIENITSGKVYTFTEAPGGKGDYIWAPSVASERIGLPGDRFRLYVQTGSLEYESFTSMGRVPVIDSLTFTYQEENAFQPESYYGEFWAWDLKGANDTYWIKTTKNGKLLNEPGDINVAYDAGFSKGAAFDNLQFIPPIRYAMNPEEEDENDEPLSPYVPGDSAYVEINSISESAFNYLQQVVVETDREGGFGELFSAPLSNVSTNISNVNKNGKKALGFFNVAAVSGKGKKFVLPN